MDHAGARHNPAHQIGMLIKTNLLQQAEQTRRAIEMINLGARPIVLMEQTGLNRNRIMRLYRDVGKKGAAPKGQAPSSPDWFLLWRNNVDASLFANIHAFVAAHSSRGDDTLTKSYKLYLEHIQAIGAKRLLSYTRAWTLLRFMSADMLHLRQCDKCGGRFIALPSVKSGFMCVMCRPRIGPTRKKLD